MINEDTIYLLRECNAGTQMAVYSIGEILENVKDQKLREILISSKNHHEQLGNELHILLQKYGDTTKDPGVIAKGMSWIKTNAKLAIDDSDRVCADLIRTAATWAPRQCSGTSTSTLPLTARPEARQKNSSAWKNCSHAN